MKIDIVSYSGIAYWRVLADGDIAGNIALYPGGWKFFKHTELLGGRYTDAQIEQITAAAKEKVLILNIARRLTT